MSTSLRAKWLVSRYGHVVAAALLLVSLAAFAGAASAYDRPPAERVTTQVNEQTIAAQLETRAVVTGNTTLYEPGEVLRNKPVYFVRASPRLTLELSTAGPAGEPLTATHVVVLEHRATRDGEAFWRENRTLVREELRTAGRPVASTTTLNVTRVLAFVDARQSEISDVGLFETEVVVRVDYETSRYAGSFTADLPLVLTGRAYWLGADFEEDRSHSETVVETVPGERDLALVVGLAAVGMLALAGAAGALGSHRRLDPLTLETRLSRSQYEEWISDGEFPTGTDKKYVRINSLEDLVDVAIDSNRRVLYDEELDIYAVIDADIIFYFSTEPLNVDSWLDV